MPWTPGSNGPDGDQNPWGAPGGGPRRPGGGGPWRGGPRGGGPGPLPDLDALIARLQAGIRGVLPGGGRGGGGAGRGPGGILGGGRAVVLLAIVAVAFWLASGFYRVEPDQQGIVLRFGAFNRTALPGLNYHLPWPVETVLTPAVTRINRTEVGYRSGGIDQETGRDEAAREVPAESLMLTGDENIIDINLTVFWRIRDAGAYLFNTRHPARTVKSVAESVVREVIGRTPIQPALTEARARIEQDVTTGTQKILDQYGTGVEVTQVQLQRVDPPAAVIDAFRDVQRATTEAEQMRNEAESYHNDIVPRARGEAARLVAEADGARQASIAEATGQAQRFLSVLTAYQAAKEVTLRRLYIETMQGILSHNQSLIVDDSLRGMLPVLPLGLPAGGGAAPSAQPAPTFGMPPLGAPK
jgi:membrane protease subunit HflK